MTLHKDAKKRLPDHLQRLIDNSLAEIQPTLDTHPKEVDQLRKRVGEVIDAVIKATPKYCGEISPARLMVDLQDNNKEEPDAQVRDNINGIIQTLGCFIDIK